MPRAATTSGPRRTGTATEQAPRLISSTGGGEAVAVYVRQLSAQGARLGDVYGVTRLRSPSTRHSPPAGAWASSTLPTPVACIGSRDHRADHRTDARPRSR